MHERRFVYPEPEELTFVVRAAGERTEAACVAQLRGQLLSDAQLTVIHERPFSRAVTRTFELGIESGRPWLVAVDADLLLLDDAVERAREICGKMAPEAFCATPLFLCKTVGGFASRGLHCYRASLLYEALGLTDQLDPDLRPESRYYGAMKARGYTREEYPDIAREFKRRFPEGELAADFIVGFPGETEADHEQSVSLLHEVGFQQSFVFRYSERPATTAARRFEDDVPLPVKAARNLQLLKTQEAVSIRKHEAMVGRAFEVLVEGPSKKDPEMFTGRTRGNHIIHFPGGEELVGELVDVTVTDYSPVSLRGRLDRRAAG